MSSRIPQSERTREGLRDLIEGCLSSESGRSGLVRLATRLIIEEGLEAEVQDDLSREYYEHGRAPGRGYRNGVREGRLKTAEGFIAYSAPQVTGTAEPFRSELRSHLKGHSEALVLTKTLRETPANATHWSVRSMARAVGISHTSVRNIWRAHGLKPHLVETFKVSNDPAFAEKVADVAGLYLDPPDKALVLSVDEKSQIQALDRTQPGLPMKKGRTGTMTAGTMAHDDKRNGTTTLFTPLNVLDGKVIGRNMQRHRHQEFIRFLNRIDRQTPPCLDIHLIIDTYGAHKTPGVKRWLKKHPRLHIHFTPTSASWLNMIERFFAEITRKRIRRGAFKSVAELEQAIYDYLVKHNRNPVPFVWTATAKGILEKTARAKKTLKTVRAETKC